MTQSQKAIDEKLKTELFSSDETKVLTALATIEKDGSRGMVEPVLELLVRSDSEAVKQEVLNQMSQLKIGDMEDLFMEKLQHEDFKSYQQQVIACMWNSGMNPINHLDVLAEVAVKGDYMTALEVLTLVENMEGPFDHESLTDAFSEVGLFLSELDEETIDPRLDLIKDLYAILHHFQEE
ncbi:MAG: hypothetical protein AB8B53_08460 [Flavobacteriales bacterium]